MSTPVKVFVVEVFRQEVVSWLLCFTQSSSSQVGYLAGSNGQPLLPQYLSDLDSALIPVIHSGACQLSEGPVVMELVFYILEIIS